MAILLRYGSDFFSDKWNISGSLGAILLLFTTNIDYFKMISAIGGVALVLMSVIHSIQKLRINAEKLKQEKAKTKDLENGLLDQQELERLEKIVEIILSKKSN